MIQGRHGELEHGKVHYSIQKIFDRLFLLSVEKQNLGKDQTLPAVAALYDTRITKK